MSTNEEAMPWALTPAQSKEVADRQVAKALAKFAEENGGGPGGPLLKFKKDEHFVLGADKVPEGTEYIAFPQEVRKGWSKFEDKKLVEEKSGKPVLGFVLPERDELGDNDPKKWPKNAGGQPTDPWVKQSFLATGERRHGAGRRVRVVFPRRHQRDRHIVRHRGAESASWQSAHSPSGWFL